MKPRCTLRTAPAQDGRGATEVVGDQLSTALEHVEKRHGAVPADQLEGGVRMPVLIATIATICSEPSKRGRTAHFCANLPRPMASRPSPLDSRNCASQSANKLP